MAETNAGAVDCGGQAGSAAGRVEGGRRSSGAQLASHAGQVSTLAQIALRRRARGAARALRRRARGAALANHARSRGLRYGGHSNNSSWASMSKGVALGCLSSVLALIDGGSQPRCTPSRSRWPPGGAGVGGALLRTPMAVRPLAAGKVRALPSHGQAGNSGCGAGGAAARRGRGVAGGRWSAGTVACKWKQAQHCWNIARDGAGAEPNPGNTWGVCRQGRARRKMERWPAKQCERRRASLAPLATFFVVRDHGDKRPKRAHDAPQPRQRRTPNCPLARATAAP